MAETTTTESKFSFVGEQLSLDFTNTVGGRFRNEPDRPSRDYFHDYADLLEWGRQAGVIDELEAHQMSEQADLHPNLAVSTLEQAKNLRELIYRIFTASLHEQAPDPTDLEAFNDSLAGALAHLQIMPTADGFEWKWRPDPAALDRVLWPVVRSAAELLTSSQKERVRRCASDTCGWVFLDTTKNHSRQWCDMKDCGNRAKAHRHYHRSRTK